MVDIKEIFKFCIRYGAKTMPTVGTLNYTTFFATNIFKRNNLFVPAKETRMDFSFMYFSVFVSPTSMCYTIKTSHYKTPFNYPAVYKKGLYSYQSLHL
jgi:hypothetical protein